MPEAVLKFDLPDEAIEFKTACDASRIKTVLWDLDRWLCTKLKHGDWPEGTEETYAAYELFRENLHRLLEEHGVNLDD